jgi:hypothetical protein
MADADPGFASTADTPLMASSGALGDEMTLHKKRSKKSKKSKSESKKTKVTGGTSKLLKPPTYDEAPLSEKNNLAGRVDYHLRSPLGVKTHEVKVAKPYHQVNLTTEPFITFVIQANKNEFIRFHRDSLSLVFYGTWNNRDAADDADTDEGKSKRWSLRAGKDRPTMFMDPSVLGSGFFHRVETMVDNVPCLSNSDLNSLHLPYVRMTRIFTDKPPGPYFATSNDFTDPSNPAMTAGMAPFDAPSWDFKDGYRMPVYLDGYFPFNLKNRTLESIDRSKEPNLYFPPDTTITIKLHAHRTKMESIFHPEIAPSMDEYFDSSKNIGSLDAYGIRFSLLDASLAYESVQLHPTNHADVIKAFRSGGSASYNYDRVSCQHTALMPGLSMTENRFQIQPHARLVYILFLPDYATFSIEAMRRPLSGLTRFPQGCTSMKVSFAGEDHLIHERLENFGISGRQVDSSKHIYWSHLHKNRMIAAKFEQMFPKLEDEYSVIQALCINLKNCISKKVETLSLKLEFSGTNTSPERQQIVVMSVHPTGTLHCSMEPHSNRWNWQFGNLTFD